MNFSLRSLPALLGAMGRPRGSKNSKSKSLNMKSSGLTYVDARKTGFMDQVLGLGALEIPDPVLS